MFTRLFKVLPLISASVRFKMTQIKTFAFFDLETTGLPSMENNRTRITELTILTLQTNHLLLGVIPRVQNKLTICFNPGKMVSLKSEEMTGLHNDLLEDLAQFNRETVDLINNFLNHNPKPICLVAHNGDEFDFPIFKAEIDKTGKNLLDDVLCVDSLYAFRKLHLQEEQEEEKSLNSSTNSSIIEESLPLEFQDGYNEILCKAFDDYYEKNNDEQGIKRELEVQKINETTPSKIRKKSPSTKVNNNKSSTIKKNLNFGISFKLHDVYERLTKRKSEKSHEAEADVNMLALATCTIAEKFLNYANKNAINFTDIRKMTPGRKIGT